MPNKLSDWKWCVDYSNSVGQKDAKIPPIFFETREDARDYAYHYLPEGGRVVQVIIKEKRKK